MPVRPPIYRPHARSKAGLVYQPPGSERGTSTQRGYGSRWQRARKTYLSHRPLCAECERQGKPARATVVDHIVPHKGDQQLFWDESNWQPLCKTHHDEKTAREDGGFGNPRHPPRGV